MKDITIHSFEELQEVVFADCFDKSLKRYRNNVVYHGISNKDFKLMSKLNRVCGHNIELEDSVIRSFKKYGFADLTNINSFWQLLATGQHFGLPTRLLDWTYSPLVAAHFATVDLEDYDKDGVIYCVDIKKTNKKLPPKLKEEIKKRNTSSFTIGMLGNHAKNLKELKAISKKPFFLFFEPASSDNRISNQYALFSMCSDPNYNITDLIDDDSMYRIIIPKEVKLEIRDKLDYINISERLIYPGLEGVCSWITRHYSNLGDKE